MEHQSIWTIPTLPHTPTRSHIQTRHKVYIPVWQHYKIGHPSSGGHHKTRPRHPISDTTKHSPCNMYTKPAIRLSFHLRGDFVPRGRENIMH